MMRIAANMMRCLHYDINTRANFIKISNVTDVLRFQIVIDLNIDRYKLMSTYAGRYDSLDRRKIYFYQANHKISSSNPFFQIVVVYLMYDYDLKEIENCEMRNIYAEPKDTFSSKTDFRFRFGNITSRCSRKTSMSFQVRSGMEADAGAARRRVHLAAVLRSPSDHRPGRRQVRHARILQIGLHRTQRVGTPSA